MNETLAFFQRDCFRDSSGDKEREFITHNNGFNTIL